MITSQRAGGQFRMIDNQKILVKFIEMVVGRNRLIGRIYSLNYTQIIVRHLVWQWSDLVVHG